MSYRTYKDKPTTQIRIVEPVAEPITLKQAKDFLRIEHDEEDSMIWDFITEARDACENYTGRALITQTWQIFYSFFPYTSLHMDLRHGPIQSVTSVKFIRSDDTEGTMDSSLYYLTDTNLHGRIVLNYGDIFPADTLRYQDSVKIEFISGYGDTGDDLPAQLKRGLLHYVAGLYEHREEGMIPEQAKECWSQFRLIRV